MMGEARGDKEQLPDLSPRRTRIRAHTREATLGDNAKNCYTTP